MDPGYDDSAVLDLVLGKLSGVTKRGGYWMARCPAHEDAKASLSIKRGTDQPVIFYCLAGDTRVITREGTMTLAAMAGEKHELLVPSLTGGPAVWQKAPVLAFGTQRLLKVTLHRFGATKVIHATAEHRWFTERRNGRQIAEVTTARLRPGDRLKAITPRRRVEQLSSVGVAHGFTFGDGSLLKRGLGSVAQFCGAKDEALLPYFPHMTAYEIGPGVRRIHGLPSFFKQPPPITEAPAYLYGWLAGYFAADGSIEGPDGPAVITSASREALEFVRDVATRLGIVTYPIQEHDRHGYGEGPSRLYKVTLRALDLPEEFFIIPAHRTRWAGRTRSTSYDTWRVVSVEPTDRLEEVYCAVVEGAHAFALEDNILTGNCHAGCQRDDVLAELGLTLADVSAPRDDRDPGEWTPRGPAIAVYDYRDEKGSLLFQVLRTADKQFPARRPDPLSRSGWTWRLGDTRRVIYRLPQVLAAIDAGEPIWVTEGEKDADRLTAEGVCATCNPHGAGKWLPEFAEWFRDAVVSIVADADRPGRAHARAVARSLEGAAAAVEIREPATGKDVSDHLAAGKTLGELVTTREADPGDPQPAMDLHAFLAVAEEPQRWVIPDLLEHGDRLILTGTEGVGKSSLARQLAVGAACGVHPFTGYLIDPARVLFVDCENSERKSRRRFRGLVAAAKNMTRPVPAGQFVVIHQPRGIDLTKDEWRQFLTEQVTAHRPDLLVCGPLYKLHAVDTNEETSARAIVDALDAAIEVADCALITEAHSSKGSGPGGHRRLEPKGSQLFTAWPDFGYGIRPHDGSRRRVDVRTWRGDREERRWPTQLAWGRPWLDFPWVVPTDPAPEEPVLDEPPDDGPPTVEPPPDPEQGSLPW